MAFTQISVTGTVKNADSSPSVGATVQFTLTSGLISTDNGQLASPTPIRTITDSSGNFSVTLVATDDTTTTPKGQVYRCDIHSSSYASIHGVNPFPPFFFPLPKADAPTVNLTSLITGPTA